jgi:hypothetical protein
VGTVAAFVRGLGFADVLAGTERVHFVVYATDRDGAHDAALRAVRQFSRTFTARDVSVSSAR